jgi:hypothetical protein
MQGEPEVPVQGGPRKAAEDLLRSIGAEPWEALVWTLLALGAIDVAFRHGRAVKATWKALVIVARYLRDLFLAPLKVRQLETRLRSDQRQAEPVHHMGIVWFMSEVEEGVADPYCQQCWGDGHKRSQLAWHADGKGRVVLECRTNVVHGTDRWDHPLSVASSDFEYAQEHAYDMRRNAQSRY